MNQRQAKRIALAVEGSFILFGATSDTVTDWMTPEELAKFHAAHDALGRELLRRAGFDRPMHGDEILRVVMGEDFLDDKIPLAG